MLFAGLFGAAQSLRAIPGADPFEPAFWASAESMFGPFARLLALHRIVAVFAALLLVLLVGVAAGLVRTLLTNFQFRLDRTSAGLRRRRGLLTKTDVMLPLRRVQSVLIETGPFRSALGWRELSLQSLASDELRGAHVVAPLANSNEIERILHEIGWRAPPENGDWQRISRSYVWMSLLAYSPLILFIASPLLLFGAVAIWKFDALASFPTGSIRTLVLIVMAMLAAIGVRISLRWLAWKRTGYFFDGDRVLIRRGWWRQRTFILPAKNVQSLDLTENLIDRRFGTVSITFGVAGASGHSLPAVPREKACQLRSELLSLLASAGSASMPR
ncbi:MAG: PH domain-containing protein [Sphingomicrobium sp.]